MVGRFIGTVTLRLYKPAKILTFHALAACGLALLTMATQGGVAMWSIIAIGLFNSIMFPTIFTLAIDGLGRHTSQGSSILVMAIVGGAIIPPLVGKVADLIGLHYCFFIPALCYVYIAWYGLTVRGPAPRGVTV
jgi:MFS transporter, FHS family, L-fucose permease